MNYSRFVMRLKGYYTRKYETKYFNVLWSQYGTNEDFMMWRKEGLIEIKPARSNNKSYKRIRFTEKSLQLFKFDEL